VVGQTIVDVKVVVLVLVEVFTFVDVLVGVFAGLIDGLQFSNLLLEKGEPFCFWKRKVDVGDRGVLGIIFNFVLVGVGVFAGLDARVVLDLFRVVGV
jgi:hypothetical protein